MSLDKYNRYLCWKNDPENLFQEEILKEKVAVLARAGDRLAETLSQLCRLDEKMRNDHCFALSPSSGDVEGCHGSAAADPEDVDRYNQIRELARRRYYELIVIREALGMRRHHWVEAVYVIPPKKKRAAGR